MQFVDDNLKKEIIDYFKKEDNCLNKFSINKEKRQNYRYRCFPSEFLKREKNKTYISLDDNKTLILESNYYDFYKSWTDYLQINCGSNNRFGITIKYKFNDIFIDYPLFEICTKSYMPGCGVNSGKVENDNDIRIFKVKDMDVFSLFKIIETKIDNYLELNNKLNKEKIDVETNIRKTISDYFKFEKN